MKLEDDDSYRIIGVVNHLGMSSNSGHYISDVLVDLVAKTWLSFDDCQVERLGEDEVLTRRVNTGYIFFYVHK